MNNFYWDSRLLKDRKNFKVRLDSLLVEKGLAGDIQLARRMIMAGQVLVKEQKIDKPGTKVDSALEVRVKGRRSDFVSRGGEKLLGALQDFALEKSIEGKVILDVGASTGGFTDCCLQLGAKIVISLDVGTAQLDWKLRQDPRVICVEKTNIVDFVPENFPPLEMIVGDVSFTSLARLAPYICAAAPRQGVVILLMVKPQFELRRDRIPVGGVVEDAALIREATDQVSEAFNALGYKILGHHPSRVKGREGNQEVFILGRLSS
jgi:23S rRNA (cytidine1920-2'-O)/16S rRNA (cytidine1409-2'-O)-methyltransferase